MVIPYIVLNRLSMDLTLCTSKRRVAKVMGVTYDCLRKRGFRWAGIECYGDFVLWSGLELERQRKGFGVVDVVGLPGVG